MKSDYTISRLRKMIEKRLNGGLFLYRQMLVCRGQELDLEGSKTLAFYGIREGDLVTVTRDEDFGKKKRIGVHVVTYNAFEFQEHSKTISRDMRREDTILDVQKWVQYEWGVLPDYQILHCKGICFTK